MVDSTVKRDTTNAADKTTINIEDPNGAKASENPLPKSNLKKPPTPKTPREKPVVEPKPKETKEANAKDKIKFTFKSQESVNGTATEEPTAPKRTRQTSTCQPTTSNANARTSSCVIDFKTVWFNFAAPPSVPITRKIDYTRLDWNLLSTAAPAITAWMNPSNRFAIKVVAMMKAFHLRRTAVAACLMADGLEVQGIQKHPKVRLIVFVA